MTTINTYSLDLFSICLLAGVPPCRPSTFSSSTVVAFVFKRSNNYLLGAERSFFALAHLHTCTQKTKQNCMFPGTSSRSVCELKGHEAWIRGVTLLKIAQAEGGALEALVSHSDDHTLKLWNMAQVRKGQADALIMTLEGHSAKVLGCLTITEAQSQTGSRSKDVVSHLVSFSADSQMIVWDIQASVKEGTPVFFPLSQHNGWVTGARYISIPLPNGKRCPRLLSWSRDGSFHLCNIAPLLNVPCNPFESTSSHFV